MLKLHRQWHLKKLKQQLTKCDGDKNSEVVHIWLPGYSLFLNIDFPRLSITKNYENP